MAWKSSIRHFYSLFHSTTNMTNYDRAKLDEITGAITLALARAERSEASSLVNSTSTSARRADTP